jgi:DNA-binding transcriptional regulator YiaG/uncharacterized protein YuzE
MRYLFDKDGNSLSVTFAEGRKYRDSAEVSDGVVVDFDDEGRPYAIEFLRADKFVDIDGLVSGRPVRLVPTAIEESGQLTRASLKRWREHLALTHEDLAARLQLTPDIIAAWEAGDRPIEYPAVFHLALKAIEGNAHEEYLRQALRDVTETLQAYLKNESVPLELASAGRLK